VVQRKLEAGSINEIIKNYCHVNTSGILLVKATLVMELNVFKGKSSEILCVSTLLDE